MIDLAIKLVGPISAIIILLFLLKECDDAKFLKSENARLLQEDTIRRGNITVLRDSIEYWVDADSNSRSEITILSGTRDMLKNDFKDLNSKYKDVMGKDREHVSMISYLSSQITIKEREIADLKSSSDSEGSRIINDSTIMVDVGKKYDSLNYYRVTGPIKTRIVNNKILAGNIDLTTQVGLGIELAVGRDPKTKIATITSKTSFPAKVKLSGITQIENEINKTPTSYLGLGIFAGYGATLTKTPTLGPMIGIGAWYSPSWLTIKRYKK